MDLDDEELMKLQKDAEDEIQNIVDDINNACKELTDKHPIIKHLAIVGYVDDEILARGFISSKYNLDRIESLTTFLLDFTSKNIKENVRQAVEEQAEQIKEQIKKEEEKLNEEK